MAFWVLKLCIVYSNIYVYPENNKEECKDVNNLLSSSYVYSVISTRYSSWHQNLYPFTRNSDNNLYFENIQVQLKCPAYWGEVNLFEDGKLFATSRYEDSSINENNSNFQIKDCHNNILFTLSPVTITTNTDKLIFSKSKYLYHYAIQSNSTPNETIGFIVKEHLVGLSYKILDTKSDIIAEIEHNYTIFSFSLRWDIKIINTTHKAANSILILVLISKKLYNKDLCNECYLLLDVLSYLSFVFVPILLWVIIKRIDAEFGPLEYNNMDNSNLIPMRDL